MLFVIQTTLKCAKYFNSAQAANKCMSTFHCKLLDHSREIIRLASSSRPHQTANSGPVDICPAYIQKKSTYTQSVLFYVYIYISCVNVALAVFCCCCDGGLGLDHPTRAPAIERMLQPSFDWISQVGSATRQNPLWDEKKSGDPVLAALAPAVAERRPACWRLNVEILLNATAETKGLGLGSVVSSNGLAFTSPSKGYDCLCDLPSTCALHACARRLFSEHHGMRRHGGGSFFVTAVSHWPGFHLDMTPTFWEKSKCICRISIKRLGTKKLR